MKSAFMMLSVCLGLGVATTAAASPYVIMDRLDSRQPKVLGIAGLYPEGCPSDFVGCSNIVIQGKIERIGYLDKENIPTLLRVTDRKSGINHSVKFPYNEIVNNIGTADTSWVMLWPKVGLDITIIGIIGGSSGNVTIDAIFSTEFLQQKVKSTTSQ